MAICLLLLLGGYGYGLERQLHWRSPVKKAQTEGVSQNARKEFALAKVERGGGRAMRARKAGLCWVISPPTGA